jgi:phage anti-repressor protein
MNTNFKFNFILNFEKFKKLIKSRVEETKQKEKQYYFVVAI